MRTFALVVFIFLASLSVPFPASALSCQTGYIERDDGSGCDLIQTSGSAGSSGNSTGLTSPGSAGQSGNTVGQSTTLINPLKGGASIESFLRSILAFVVRIGSIVVILMLVLVGYKFVTAQGEPGKISEARQMLLWTVVGALILLGAQAIATGIEKTVQALSTGG